MNENIKRIDRLANEPWLAEVSDIVTLAERRGVTVTRADIKGPVGDYTIDGMEWYQWLDAMTQDDDKSREMQSTPASGCTSCACRDCMDTTVSSDTSKPELCSECAEAGCEPCMAYVARPHGLHHECQRDNAHDA